MAPPNVTIVFNQHAPVYFPGQTISGTVKVTNTSQRKCQGIALKFEGISIVQFTNQVNRSKTVNGKTTTELETQHYYTEEQHYKSKYFVWSDPSQQLQPGSFEYPFSFIIPQNSPASFQCRYGQVLHYCQATIKLPMARDAYCKRPYSVNSLLDLNANPANKAPQQQQNMKTLCCLCCRSGPISATVRLDRLGYVPGETICVSAEVNNASNRKVNYTKAELFMDVTLTGYQGGRNASMNKNESYKLLEVSMPEIPKGDDCIWEGHRMLIPPIPASGLDGCSIINIVYSLKFTVQPKLPATSMTLKFPITIGSIPLRETFDFFDQPVNPYPGQATVGFVGGNGTFDSPQPSAPPPPENPPTYSETMFPGIQQYPDMPPPSYQPSASQDLVMDPKTMKGDDSDGDDQHADYMKNFKPAYVSYNLKKNS